ncbi:MAG: pantoate--beta-alanine ligase [Spirochaetia bacterium]|nr:pantoate--beta-alanine ligase [Spirochaetia bacterium]
MKIIKNITEMQNWSRHYRCENPDQKIGFIPTMGFLHEGHLSLIKQAVESCQCIVVSIFVNPFQFNNPDDLKNYPRNLERDILLLNGLDQKIDILFIPDSDDVYKNGRPELIMDYPDITNKLCGKTRAGHFNGVLTIVHNLFMWIKPHVAIFGLKDYQQYLLIKKMTNDLHLDVEIKAGQLIRENDGLAMSSRNSRLSSEEKNRALIISQTLFKVKNEFESGNNKVLHLKNILQNNLSHLEIDYASLYHSETLEELNEQDNASGALVAVAVYIGKVRLIDNILLN